LNALTEKYADKPFKILGFPCNQFLRQEPGANASEIFSVLKHVRPGDGFVPNFEMFAKSDVNGKNQNPIYKWLKSRCPSVRKEFEASYKLYYDPYHQDDIRWNFEKFLLDHSGQPIRRYEESLDPERIIPDIDALLERMEKKQTLTVPYNFVQQPNLNFLFNPQKSIGQLQTHKIICWGSVLNCDIGGKK